MAKRCPAKRTLRESSTDVVDALEPRLHTEKPRKSKSGRSTPSDVSDEPRMVFDTIPGRDNSKNEIVDFVALAHDKLDGVGYKSSKRRRELVRAARKELMSEKLSRQPISGASVLEDSEEKGSLPLCGLQTGRGSDKDVQENEIIRHNIVYDDEEEDEVHPEDLKLVSTILENESQSLYDPRAGAELFAHRPRDRKDHINRPIKTGPYTNEEHNILKDALDCYFKKNGWDDSQGWATVSAFGEGQQSRRLRGASSNFGGSSGHWETIALALPQRSVRSVQLYAHRRLYPWRGGKWSEQEEKDLVELVGRYGAQWTKFAYDYFHRPPNHIQTKWKELQPKLHRTYAPIVDKTSIGSTPGVVQSAAQVSLRRRWSKEEDVQLLTGIKLVTGVTLPYRAIPWTEVQKHMPPEYTAAGLAWRYKNTLFPLILRGRYKGAQEKVLLRQFIRYLRRGIETGIIRDLSDVEPHRVVPFWYAGGHIRRFSAYLKSQCPEVIQKAPLEKQVEYIAKLEKCDKKELHDLRRLARTFRALQEINGVVLLPKTQGVYSERFKNPVYQASIEHRAGDEAGANRTIVPRPLTATQEKVAEVVPTHLHQVPEAFPIYLAGADRRERKQSALKQRAELEARAGAAAAAARKNKGVPLSRDADGTAAEWPTPSGYLDYNLYASLGLIDTSGASVSNTERGVSDCRAAALSEPLQSREQHLADNDSLFYEQMVHRINALQSQGLSSDSESSDVSSKDFGAPSSDSDTSVSGAHKRKGEGTQRLAGSQDNNVAENGSSRPSAGSRKSRRRKRRAWLSLASEHTQEAQRMRV